MFAERFDALLNIAEVSNSLLGRAVNMNGSHIGRLRTGARPLPKKHEYLASMCLYLAEHIRKEYQRNALQKLTGIGDAALGSAEHTARYLEQWLLEREKDTSAATGRLISGFSRVVIFFGWLDNHVIILHYHKLEELLPTHQHLLCLLNTIIIEILDCSLWILCIQFLSLIICFMPCVL